MPIPISIPISTQGNSSVTRAWKKEPGIVAGGEFFVIEHDVYGGQTAVKLFALAPTMALVRLGYPRTQCA